MAIGLPMLRLFEQKYSTQDSPPEQESLHTSDERLCESLLFTTYCRAAQHSPIALLFLRHVTC